MVLNKDEINNISGNIGNFNADHVRHASYDLTTCSIVDMEGKSHELYKIEPQGMVYVVFKEHIKLPENIIALAHVKTSITQRGIMATNIGIVDPGYDGYLSTLLINFGKKPYSLMNGQSYLRLTFHEVNGGYKDYKPYSPSTLEQYKFARISDTDNLDKKFLNLSTVSNDVFARVMKYLVGLGIIFSCGSFLLAEYFQNKVSEERDLEKAVKRYEMEVSALKANSEMLKTTSEFLKTELKSMQDSTKKMSTTIKTLKK